MSSSSENVYFLSITVVPQKEGLDVPALIRKVAALLADNAPGITFIHKFKVTGEAKVVAFVEVHDSGELERTVAGLWKIGPVDVECQPIICYEKFARNMQVAEELCKKTGNCLEKEGLFWQDVSIEYHGLKYDDFMALWKKEAETVLSLRTNGLAKIELFKCVSQRRLFLLLNNLDAAQLDLLFFQLPILVENGNNIHVKTKGVQFLDDYIELAALKI